MDRSIDEPLVFGTNVIGTLNLLQCAHSFGKKTTAKTRGFAGFTDEVYGSIENDTDLFTESSDLLPSSPYSAKSRSRFACTRVFNNVRNAGDNHKML